MKIGYKKYMAGLLISIIMWVMTACSGGEYKVQNEENALEVYRCSDDNMLGLEKTVVFEDKVIIVFDKSINDRYKYGHLANTIDFGIDRAYGHVSLSNVTGSCTGVDSIDIVDGRYVVTLSYSYEKYIVDPNEPCEVVGAGVSDADIRFNNGDLELSYSLSGGECVEVFVQTYEKKAAKWSSAEKEEYLFPLESSME